MGKKSSDLVMDAALDYIQANGGHMVVLSASAYDTSAAVVSATLASATTASADFTKADGDTNGRKVTVASHSGTTITASGTATHLALINTNGSAIYQTTTGSQALTSGTVDIPAWDIEIADPT
jgi:hypothetical protein